MEPSVAKMIEEERNDFKRIQKKIINRNEFDEENWEKNGSEKQFKWNDKVKSYKSWQADSKEMKFYNKHYVYSDQPRFISV